LEIPPDINLRSTCILLLGKGLRAMSRPMSDTMRQYAWLELDAGVWHLTMRLTAEPSEAVRRWSELQPALAELAAEGWTVVRPYPRLPADNPREPVAGFGLTRLLS